MTQLHKKFTDSQVRKLIKRYLKKEIKRSYIEEILDIKRRRFCELVKKYRKSPDNFSIQYKREMPTRNISKDIEENIIKELSIEKNLISDANVPLKTYNYSNIKDRLEIVYDQKVSLPTIIIEPSVMTFIFKGPRGPLMIERF